jgi:DNA-binding transcriptional regulator YdaS (Cro superfamily)
MTGIERAIDLAGGETALGELLGVSQQAINKMKRKGYVTLQRAEQIANNFPIEVSQLVDPEVVRLMKEHR